MADLPSQISELKTCKNKKLLDKIDKETKEQIQLRLRTKEAEKARRLLSLAMTNYEALKFMTKIITKKVLETKDNGNS